MECSMCEKTASYLVYHYSNDKRIEFVEARCAEHFSLDQKERKKKRKEIQKMRRGKKPQHMIRKIKKDK